jgi:hypothetical protein
VALKGTVDDMKRDERYVYGPRPVGALVPRLARPVFRRRTPATAQVLADWDAIMGPALAAVTTPRRLVRGTLTIACVGPIAMELQHLATEVMARINGHLGTEIVTALRFVQTAARRAPLKALPTPPDPARLAIVEAALADLPAGALRDALAALGRAIPAQGGGSSSSRSPKH